jgi:hypothetical protein
MGTWARSLNGVSAEDTSTQPTDRQMRGAAGGRAQRRRRAWTRGLVSVMRRRVPLTRRRLRRCAVNELRVRGPVGHQVFGLYIRLLNLAVTRFRGGTRRANSQRSRSILR